jgi:hypothetical protein
VIQSCLFRNNNFHSRPFQYFNHDFERSLQADITPRHHTRQRTGFNRLRVRQSLLKERMQVWKSRKEFTKAVVLKYDTEYEVALSLHANDKLL